MIEINTYFFYIYTPCLTLTSQKIQLYKFDRMKVPHTKSLVIYSGSLITKEKKKFTHYIQTLTNHDLPEALVIN